MQNAIAFANNDVITVAWSFGQKLDGCMGFAVYRIDAHGKSLSSALLEMEIEAE